MDATKQFFATLAANLVLGLMLIAAAVILAPGRAPDGPAASPYHQQPYCPEPPLRRAGSETIRQADGQHYFHFRDGQLVGAWRWRTREYFPRNPYGVGGWGGPSRPPDDFTPPIGDVGDVAAPASK